MEIHCKYVQTPETYKELRWHTLNWPLIVIFCTALVAIIGGLVAGAIYGFAENNTLMLWYCAILALVILISSLQVPWAIITHLRVPKKLGKVDMSFYDDRIAIRNKDKSDSRTYECVKNIKETRSFFVIIFETENKQLSFLPVKKSGLSCEPIVFKDCMISKINHRKDKNYYESWDTEDRQVSSANNS
jgi:hypothetical protein